MEKEVNKELVQSAVNYWSNFLKDPNSVVLDNGEASQFLMMNALAKLGGVEKYDKDKIIEFELLLTEYITDGLKEGKRISLSVDYHPEEKLREFLDDSIGKYNSMSIFPCKTNMSIDSAGVKVKEGYGKPYIDIYPVQEKVDNTTLLEDGKYYVVNFDPNMISINFKYYNFDMEKINFLGDNGVKVQAKFQDGKWFMYLILDDDSISPRGHEIKILDLLKKETAEFENWMKILNEGC